MEEIQSHINKSKTKIMENTTQLEENSEIFPDISQNTPISDIPKCNLGHVLSYDLGDDLTWDIPLEINWDVEIIL
jgi:hypothetical protein